MEQRCKFCLLWLRARQTDPEDMESMGALSETCSQIALQCFSSARIGRPYLRWARTIWPIQSQEGAQFPKVCADPVSMMIGRSKDWHCAITNLYRFSNELVWHRHSLLRSQKKINPPASQNDCFFCKDGALEDPSRASWSLQERRDQPLRNVNSFGSF